MGMWEEPKRRQLTRVLRAEPPTPAVEQVTDPALRAICEARRRGLLQELHELNRRLGYTSDNGPPDR